MPINQPQITQMLINGKENKDITDDDIKILNKERFTIEEKEKSLHMSFLKLNEDYKLAFDHLEYLKLQEKKDHLYNISVGSDQFGIRHENTRKFQEIIIRDIKEKLNKNISMRDIERRKRQRVIEKIKHCEFVLKKRADAEDLRKREEIGLSIKPVIIATEVVTSVRENVEGSYLAAYFRGSHNKQ